MKKFLFQLILTILLPYSLGAMNMQRILRTPSRLEFQKRSCSGYNSPKSLGALSFYEISKLAQNKKLAQKKFKSALARYEDTKTASISQQSTGVKNAWKKIFAQFSIQNWNSMLLEREEQSVLETINPKLPDLIKTFNFEKLAQQNNKDIEDKHDMAKKHYNAQPLDESLQKYYQKNLEIAGYPKIPTIYYWDGDSCSCACNIYPNAYVTSDFFNFPLEERLGILAHEDQHAKNFHRYKKLNIYSFNPPIVYLRFTEKEADLKAGAHSFAIATGLLHFLKRQEEKEKLKPHLFAESSRTHPLPSESVSYLQDLIGKLEQEQKGYSWNPFYKILGLTEWLKK